MRLYKLILIGLCAVAAVSSCKKEETTDVKDFLDGKLNIDFPKYVEPGFTKEFSLDSLMTAKRPDGGKIGYYYKSCEKDAKNDTLVYADGRTSSRDNFVIIAPKEKGEYSFNFTAYCEDKYYSSTVTTQFNVVVPGLDGEGSLKGFVIDKTQQSFVDNRDGKEYLYTTIGQTDWMRHNLAWAGLGASHENSKILDDIFGRLYNQEDAKKACPEGWRLPSEKDWVELARIFDTNSAEFSDFIGIAGDLMADVIFNDTKLWEYWKDVNISDKSQLSIMPTGYALIEDDKYNFIGFGRYAALWTSESGDDWGLIRYIYEKKNMVFADKVSNTEFACSVRCVR